MNTRLTYVRPKEKKMPFADTPTSDRVIVGEENIPFKTTLRTARLSYTTKFSLPALVIFMTGKKFKNKFLITIVPYL